MRYVLIFCCLYSNYTLAVDIINFKLDSFSGIGWKMENITVKWNWDINQHITLKLNIANLHISQLEKPIKNIKLICPNVEYNLKKIICANADLQIGEHLLDKSINPISFNYEFDTQTVQLNLEQLFIADGKLKANIYFSPSQWQIQLDIYQLQLRKFLNKINDLIKITPIFNLDVFIQNLNIQAWGDKKLRNISIHGKVNNLEFSNNIGTLASENLAVDIALNIKPLENNDTQHGYEISTTLKSNHGEFYINPIYVNSKTNPITIKSHLAWQAGHLTVHSLRYIHTNIGDLTGQGKFQLLDKKLHIKQLSAELIKTPVKPIYTNYIKVFFTEDSQLNHLDINGIATIKIKCQLNKRHVFVQLYDVDIADKRKKFSFNGLRGVYQWHSNNSNFPSNLHIKSGYLINPEIKLGTSQLHINISGNNIKLLAPWNSPIFDGNFYIEQFAFENMGRKNVSWSIKGHLSPISLSKLTEAFGWKNFHGKVSANIPLINYRNQQLNMNNKLRIKIFNGDIILDNLLINNSLEDISDLTANIKIKQLDLKSLTTAVQFGEIQGKLSGYIKQLHLINWQPIAFNAYLGTENNNTQQVISVKAIKNLSSIDNNSGSNMLLNFFGNIYYDNIGLGCRLQTYIQTDMTKKRVCYMKGNLARTKDSYYIVKSSNLIPRINIIGYNKQVDLDILLNRIQNAINVTKKF
ncbi:MAG: hypothetical protein KAH84_10995 [Thiomargarita sp.]|nr:hypothetical protein [Thiomargarita sp.]